MVKYNYSCLIRKNTPELIKALENLGYTNWSVFPEDDGILATMFNFKTVSFSLPDVEEPTLIGLDADDYDSYLEAENFECVDCDENEMVFLAIAAIRDDSDAGQFFIYTEDDDPVTCGRLVLCEADSFEDEFWSWNSNDDLQPYMFRKATPEEIVDYFL